jgi:pilus assembly protein FimV
MNPALSGLHMTIVRRDGRQYLRVSTSRPIEADYLHLFLELSGGGRQEVRAATVWLQADPNPSMRASAVPAAAVGSLRRHRCQPWRLALLSR